MLMRQNELPELGLHPPDLNSIVFSPELVCGKLPRSCRQELSDTETLPRVLPVEQLNDNCPPLVTVSISSPPKTSIKSKKLLLYHQH